jgi:tetratricopeptide (TPR) repeat protein
MTFDAEAMLAFYSGDLTRARQNAVAADSLGSRMPHAYLFATSLCMIESISGNLTAAIAHGERALSRHPRQVDACYPPTLRYLGASYSAAGRYDDARRIFGLLGRHEIALRSEQIRPSCYPTPSEQAASFIRSGLKLVDM